MQSLVSNQLNKMSQQLISRGVEPRLIPSIRAPLQQTWMAVTRRLPLVDTAQEKDAIAKLSAVLATTRALVSAAVRQALLAG